MKIYRVVQDDVRLKKITRMESYVLADKLSDVANEYAPDEESLDHILIAIIEIGTAVRTIKEKLSD